MKTKLMTLGTVVGLLACGGDAKSPRQTDDPMDRSADAGLVSASVDAIAVATASDLPACDLQHRGQLAYVASEGKLYACLDGSWNSAKLDAGGDPSGDPSGADGKEAMVVSHPEAAGANCASGGTRLDFGVDDNGNGTLEPSEIDASAHVCNGANGDGGTRALVATTPEGAGATCPSGGLRVDVGGDDNGNGTLEVPEVQSTQFVCNGALGSAGPGMLISSSAEAAGPNCAAGGVRFDLGVDDDGNGKLASTETDDTQFACSGAPRDVGPPGPVAPRVGWVDAKGTEMAGATPYFFKSYDDSFTWGAYWDGKAWWKFKSTDAQTTAIGWVTPFYMSGDCTGAPFTAADHVQPGAAHEARVWNGSSSEKHYYVLREQASLGADTACSYSREDSMAPCVPTTCSGLAIWTTLEELGPAPVLPYVAPFRLKLLKQ